MDNPILDLILKELKKATELHFEKLKETHPEKTIQAYCLYTSDDVSSISPVSNLRDKDISSDENKEVYYRYCADEWSEWDDFGFFDEVNQLIKKYCDEKGDDFKEYKDILLFTFRKTLQELQLSGFFGEKRDDFFLTLWISDSSEKSVLLSVSELNTKKVFEEFKKEFYA